MIGTSLSGLLAITSGAGPVAMAFFGFAIGVLLGLIHFGSLWWTTRAFVQGEPLRALLSQLFRFALLLLVLGLLAKLGALPLLSGALGLLLARGALLRRLGRPA